MTAEGGAAAAAARWGAVAATALACALGLCGVAAAAPVSEPQPGYWWQPEPVSGLIPVPGVPSNGLYVASSPTGPQAISAVRFDVSDPSAVVRLTLHVSPQEQVGLPAVVAYPATGRWQISGPQPWSARPSYRSSAKPIVGVFQGRKLMTLTFPARDASTGIVLLPDPRAVNKTFTIAFTPPHAADISVRSTTSSPPSNPASTSPHPKPTKTHHPSSPAPTPTHSHTTHKPSKSPAAASHRTTVPTPTPSASGSASPALPAAASSSGHGTRNALIIGLAAAVLLILLTAFRVTVSRRRPPT